MKKYMVGGAVRDRLMGIEPKDIDYVVVGSTPEEMIAAGFKQVGADFPVFLDENGVEYALARTERKSGVGYNGFVTDHSKKVTLREDLKRRDLTINAIAMDENGTIIDPFNGAKHIERRQLKHVSKAFAEDPVRVLRLARFRARLGAWKIYIPTRDLCRKMVADGELNHLTKERVLKELEKAMGEPYTDLFFKTLDMVNALHVVFPQFDHYDDVGVTVRRRLGGAMATKLKYARMSQLLVDTDAFEEMFNVSTEWRRYRKMYRTSIGSMLRRDVDALYAMDAYRQRDLAEEMFDDIEEANDERCWVWAMRKVFDKTKNIGFDDLTEEQRATLKGPAIAEAIKAKRMEVACG